MEDVILKKHYEHLYNRLKGVLGKSNKEAHEQRALKYELMYIMKIVEKGYYEFLISDLWESIKNDKCSETIFLTGILASHCINHGWSAKALKHKVNVFKGEKRPEEKWQEFVELISCEINREFDVLVKLYLRGYPNTAFDNIFSALERLGVESKTREMVKEEYRFFDETKLKIGENGRYLLVKVSAHDRFSAATLALQKMSEALNMVSFFGMIEGWNVKDTTLFVIDKQKESVKMIPPKTLYATYDYLDSSSKIFVGAQRIFSREGMDVVKSKLNGAFSYANLSKESMFQEEKYINAWVALESLARTDMCKDIISNVLENVPAALCQRYIYRLMRNFIEDCLRCEVDLTRLQIHVNGASKKKNVEEMYEVLQERGRYLALLQACGVNKLLENRCKDIYRLATDVKAAGRKVIQHHENVEWQLQRLY